MISLTESMTAPIRIVVLGKTGAGKSSLANTIFGEPVFKIDTTANSGTSTCQAETRTVGGRSITWIDTPGFFDTARPEEEMKAEIVKCIAECAPGPHAFLIVLKVEKFTAQEEAVIAKIQQYFSEEVFKYAIVVFTRGDELPEGTTIEMFVKQSKGLSDLGRKCGDRCHVIDNKHWKKNCQDEYRSNQLQVEQLLKTIDKMTQANGGCYTNEMLQACETKIQEEEGKLSSANMSREAIRVQAKILFAALVLRAWPGVTTGALLGLFLCERIMNDAVELALGVAMGAVGGVEAVYYMKHSELGSP